MKKFKIFLYTALATAYSSAQISYNFTAVSGSYSSLTAYTPVHSAGADDAISSVITLPFTFYYGCQAYTTCQISTNGVMFLGTTAAGSNMTNNLTSSTDRPAIAPLWDDLAVGSGGRVVYATTGTAPNRVFTVEWYQMEWNYGATTWGISFQVKLYETSNRIEFVYQRNGNATANLNLPSASIGISGPTSGDFYSLNNTSASPTASKVTETTTLNSKPATGQIYRWDPVMCSGTPSGYVLSAAPSNSCSAYTTTLTVTGSSSGCGIQYQFQSASSIGGPYTTFSTTSSPTATFNVTATRYFRVVVTCTVSGGSMTTNTVTAVLNTGIPCVCDLIQISSLPYNSGSQTTCGMGNNVTSANVTNVCGSTSYYNGEDVVYSFTPTTTGTYQINLTSTGSWTGLMLYQGCPLSGGTCVANNQSSTGNKQICTTLNAGTTYFLVIDSYPSPTCNPYSLSISAINTAACNMNYSASSTTYNFETFSGTPLPMTDDVLFNTTVLFGFSTCFDGVAYSQGYPASNSSFVFDAICTPNIQTSTYAGNGVSTGYVISAAAPVAGTSVPRNAILGPWHDIYPSSSATVATSQIQYATLGVAPNRRFIVSWEDIPYFDCEASLTPYFSGQIKIFENGDIEIHIKNKRVCASWNGGDAILGLHNYDGTIYIPPVNNTAHNYPTNWTMTNTAYKFTNGCPCNPLPIGFSRFYGERIQKVNHLYWETSEESHLMLYEIFRSEDGINFEKIGEQKPNNQPSKYHFEDYTAPLGKISYYKVKAVENDGKIKETNIISITAEMNEVFLINLFPNPTKDELNVIVESRLTTQNGIAIVNVYDVFGKVALSKEIKILGGVNTYKINTEELAEGVYTFELILNDKEKVIQKIIKQ